MKRSRLRSRGRRLSPEEATERDHVLQRDGGCVLSTSVQTAGNCMGQVNFHHLRKQVHGGTYDRANGVALCNFHNDWVEMYPLVAHSMGLVLRAGEGEWDAWSRMRAYGLPVGFESAVEA